MITLESPIESVLGASTKGKKAKRIVEGLGLRTVGDLLDHFPRRYLKTGELTRVEELEEGQLLTLVGERLGSRTHTYKDRRTGKPAYRLDVTLRTDGSSLRMSFFAKSKHISEWQADRLRVGRRGIFLGKAGTFRSEWQLTNPQMVLFGSGDEDAAQMSLDALGEFYPIYPLTAGVDSWDLQRAVTFALTVLDDVPELLPQEVRDTYGVLDIRTAYDWIHAPHDLGQVRTARRRFRFEEALVTQLVLGRRRRELTALGAQARTGDQGALLERFDERLPFELTAGQREVGAEIERELAEPHPMHRLLQGEVGSGKTVVALRAMLRVVDSGGQAALLAPTEVLAQQHHRSMTAMLGDLAGGGMLGGAEDATRVALLTGSLPAAARKRALLEAASGEAGIVVGTHALIQETVQFADLGLVVVDE